MADVIVIDNDSITMWYHPDKKIVHHEMHKFTFGKPFREALNQGVELMKKNKAQKWLSDDRLNPVLTKEDTEWAQTNWFPETLKAGWKFWAIVQPQQIIGKINMEGFAKQYAEYGIVAKLFSDPKDAMNWLESQ
ncbi:MAG: hypothetical protein P4L50_26710 [Anaerolineaceae bacterium]|nr:hypothetical protein [Anaerolineaceae bacterium]